MFITKYNSAGTRQWTLQDGASLGNVFGVSLSLDPSNDVVLAGYTMTSFDGQTKHGNSDFYIKKYNSSGTQ